MYRAFGLLRPDSDFTLAEAEKRLLARFPDAAAERGENQVAITTDGWDIHLWLNAGPEVPSESIGFAEHISGLVDGTEIESCNRRVEAWSETPDPFLEHFDKYQAVVEVLQSFRGLIAIDPKEPALL